MPASTEFREDSDVNRSVGRAVTAMYAPSSRITRGHADRRREGLSGTPNQWVIDS